MKTIYQIFQDISSLRKTPYSTKQKIAVFTSILKLYVLKKNTSKQKVTTITLLGFKITSFNIQTTFFLFREIFVHGDYFFSTNTRRGVVIVDGGANIGFATLFFKWIDPTVVIHAFEPDEETFKLLTKNIKDNNLQNVYLYQRAIATHDKGLDFFIDPDNVGSLKMSTIQARQPRKKVSVESIDFAQFLSEQKPYFVKLDIEGAETEVIYHLSEKSVLSTVPMFKIEYHHNVTTIPSEFSKLLSVLEKNNFMYTVHATGTTNSSAQSYQDILVNCQHTM